MPNIIQGPSKSPIKYSSLSTYYIKPSNSALSLGQYEKAIRKVLLEFRILIVMRSGRCSLLVLKVLLITNNYKDIKY